jgi:hypothetical protein
LKHDFLCSAPGICGPNLKPTLVRSSLGLFICDPRMEKAHLGVEGRIMVNAAMVMHAHCASPRLADTIDDPPPFLSKAPASSSPVPKPRYRVTWAFLDYG